MNKDYTILIHKVISGLADQRENDELEQWIQKEPENRQKFESFKLLWDHSDGRDPQISDAAEQEAERFESTITLLRRRDSAIRQLRKKLIIICSIMAFSVGVVTVLFLTQPESSQSASLSVKFENKQREVLLPDSSVVFLNKESSLCYEQHADSRKVWLKGEGFFQVTKDSKRPFYVFAQDAMITVRGTSFNVNAANTNRLEVCVVNGAVEVREGQRSVELAAGEKAILSNQHIAKEINRDPNFNAWHTGHYTFENVSLKEMLPFLEKEYNVKMIIQSPAILACTFTGKFSSASFEEVLETLVFTFQLDYKILKADTFELKGKGCG